MDLEIGKFNLTKKSLVVLSDAPNITASMTSMTSSK